VQGKAAKCIKKLALGVDEMYRYSNGQIRLADFGQPVGMNLKEENRWVKRAKLIPWNDIEKRYAALFTNKKGNVAKPLRLALGACIIQTEYGFSDEETALQIQEAAYLQYFCGYEAYDDSKLPFDPSLMVYFRKRLTAEVLGEINEMILTKAQNTAETPAENTIEDTKTNKDSNDDDKTEPPANGGTMIVDATCAPSQIRFPQDTALLNEARKNTEAIIDALHIPGSQKPRTYRNRAHKDYLKLARCRKPGAKKIRKCIGQQLRYLRRNLNTINEMLIAKPDTLSIRQQTRLETIRKVYDQQKSMYDHHTHSVPERIVSLSQPWLRPIVRGKAKAAVEFGAKLDISVCDGWTRLEYFSFDAYNEAGNLKDMIERYRARTGRYPERVLADKIYRNRKNLSYCAAHNIRLSGPALGRPRKDEVRDKKQDYQDQADRVEVERQFSLAKRKCGLGMIVTRLEATTCHCLAMSVLLLNLRKLQRLLHAIFRWWLGVEKVAFIQ
jgi:IS5 family transposase